MNVSPIVLANLCVTYIMTSLNEEAEELMRKIEREEEHVAIETPEKKIFHLCIVNLVIGYIKHILSFKLKDSELMDYLFHFRLEHFIVQKEIMSLVFQEL